MDLTSRPLSPYKLSDRQRIEMRCSLAKSADLLRMEGKLCGAEKLYRKAARYADAEGAADHFVRMADHCRSLWNKRSKP